LLEEFNNLSGIVAGCTVQVSSLHDQLMVTRCQLYEDTCGRINESNLSHIMVMGAPYFPVSANVQEQLKQQVTKFYIYVSTCVTLPGAIRVKPAPS